MSGTKTHIARPTQTTKRKLWTLCGRVLPSKSIVKATDATCLRCIKYCDYETIKACDDAVVRARLPETTLDKQYVTVKEIRTTSSTGGQKGVKEARYSLIPVGPLEELAVLFGRGARKYDVHQWRQGYELSKGYDAMLRHQNAFWAGKDFDICSNDPAGCQHVDSEGNPFEPPAPDTCYNHTGVHHLIAVAWHAFVMRELTQTHPDHDDRYIIKG